nr:putative reverse transcriptase domain-containing protein [Tanacetum cinerariifolium]
MLCDAPTLALPEGTDDFIVYCDALNQGKENVVADVLSRKERFKPSRARAMSMIIHSCIKAMILEAQSKASKGINTVAEMLKGLDIQFKRKEDGGLYLAEQIWVPVYGNSRTLIINESHATRTPETLRITSKARDSPVEMREYHNRLHKQKALGTRLDLSTAYHPETDGQKFSYNNSYHSSVKCAPFEALYGRKCRTPIARAEVGESKLIGSKIIQETTDKIVQIKERLKAAQDCQKSYADN